MGRVGREGVASGEVGVVGVGWRMEIFFAFFFKKQNKTNLSFNGSKNKKEKVKHTYKKRSKIPSAKIFFSWTQIALFPVTF